MMIIMVIITIIIVFVAMIIMVIITIIINFLIGKRTAVFCCVYGGVLLLQLKVFLVESGAGNRNLSHVPRKKDR